MISWQSEFQEKKEKRLISKHESKISKKKFKIANSFTLRSYQILRNKTQSCSKEIRYYR